jgi:hypothetical protein
MTDYATELAQLRQFIADMQSGEGRGFAALDSIVFGWQRAFRRLVKLQHVHPTHREAFLGDFKGTGAEHIRKEIGNDLLLIRGLRVIFSPYKGPKQTLYRGEHPSRVKRRTFGVSWSTSRNTAEGFCCGAGLQNSDGGGMLLKTVAPAEAIIYQVGGGEREYLIDRRRLGAVSVVKQFPMQRPAESG